MTDSSDLRQLARSLLDGSLSDQHFLQLLARQTFASLADTTLDLDRQRRAGYPEVIYAEGKTAESLKEIVRRLLDAGQPVLATRLDEVKSRALLAEFPQGIHNPIGRTFRLAAQREDADTEPSAGSGGQVAVVTAGTSDLSVAEEARETLCWMGVGTTLIQDVGVAGPHRLPAHLDRLRGADAIVVAAGMEGALPSVVGGYVSCPVIAVPTSVGYGASLGGLAALLGMLNSCAANVAVVNIDAGFKAGYLAGLIARRQQTAAAAHSDRTAGGH
jgi:NCAIR mutase (PurE)-related protein